MKKAPIPENEEERLAELISFEVLDSSPEPDFDDLTELASKICETPIALVSLIDEDRQWFKSHHGLDATQTPRDISFCGHAIHQDEVFEVRNSFEDERFADNPLVTGDPRVIFYAGMPLKTMNGLNIGTLCVIDHEKKELNDFQREALRTLAKQVVAQMELRRQNRHMGESLEKIRNQALQIERHRDEAVASAKMASLGVMAAGVAHEINNPLAIMESATHILSRFAQASEDEGIERVAESVSKSIDRISGITQGLLKYSRKSEGIKESLKLADILEDTLFFCKERLGRFRIELRREKLSEEAFLSDPNEISQVILNLLNNSIDALQEAEERWIEIESYVDGDSYIISVTDSGPGIDELNMIKVFDPFFTTKKVGQGTGLGLSISKGIIEGHGGEIFLDVENPKTRFKIVLPVGN